MFKKDLKWAAIVVLGWTLGLSIASESQANLGAESVSYQFDCDDSGMSIQFTVWAGNQSRETRVERSLMPDPRYASCVQLVDWLSSAALDLKRERPSAFASKESVALPYFGCFEDSYGLIHLKLVAGFDPAKLAQRKVWVWDEYSLAELELQRCTNFIGVLNKLIRER